MGVLLLLRPNRAPSLGGVLYEGEVCASRHASRRPRPHSTHRGQKRGLRRDAPLLLLAAWLGVCSAKGTICSVKPSVCSGTYSSLSLRLSGSSVNRFNGGLLSGTMPTELGALTTLQAFILGGNELSGSLPTQLGALTFLTELDLEGNELSGSLPTQLGALTALREMYLGENELSGSLPMQLWALTALEEMYLEDNELSGSLSTQLGALTFLTELDLEGNDLSGSLPTQLGALTALTEMHLGENELSGSLPTQLGALTALESMQLQMQLEGNALSGSLPTQLGALTTLNLLNLEKNGLSGSLPAQLGMLTALKEVHLDQNSLSGSLPTQLGALICLTEIELGENNHSGTLPTQLGTLTALRAMLLSRWIMIDKTGLSGSLPTQFGALTSLTEMHLEANDLSGSLPTQLAALTFLTDMFLDHNELSGSLPTQLGALTCLTEMYLENNELSGSLPTQFGVLTALEDMNLAYNHLSGSLPTQLGVLTATREVFPVPEHHDRSGRSGSRFFNMGSLESCLLGGTNDFSCPTPVEIPLMCTASFQQCVSLGSNSSGAVPSELSSGAVLLWVLLPLGMLLVVVFVLLCRYYSRMSRDRTNLRLSRDRANLDLQMLAHQVQRAHTQPNDLASQADSLSERRYTSLGGATVVSLPPGPPSSADASSVAAASLPPGPSSSTTAPTTGPTTSSNRKGKGKREAEAGNAKVPLSWAEADRQFYATAAGKAYLAACTNAPPDRPRPAPPVPAPAPLAKKAVARRFTPEGVEIHPLLQSNWNAHWRARDARDAAAPPERPATHAPAPTPAPAIDLIQGARGMWDRHVGRQWESLSDAERAQFDRDEAPSSALIPAPAPAPSTPSAPEVSSDVSLGEMAVLVDLPDEEAEAALTALRQRSAHC